MATFYWIAVGVQYLYGVPIDKSVFVTCNLGARDG